MIGLALIYTLMALVAGAVLYGGIFLIVWLFYKLFD